MIARAPPTRRQVRDEWGTPGLLIYSAVHGWATRPPSAKAT